MPISSMVLKTTMAIVFAPPISLNLDEIKAAISYLQSQGGEVDLEAINNPSEIGQRLLRADRGGYPRPVGGDPGAGEEMYADNCSDCHQLNGEGGEVGPDLSAIANKGLKFISESILVPAKKNYRRLRNLYRGRQGGH